MIHKHNQRRPVRRADNLTTFMCRLSGNLIASTYWNPQGLSRLVMGLLYLYHKHNQMYSINPLKPELNSICYLLALLAHHFLHVNRIRVKSLTLR